MKKSSKIISSLLGIILAIVTIFFFRTNNNELIAGYIGVVISLVVFLLSIRKRKEVHLVLFLGFVTRLGMAILYSFNGDADPDGYTQTAENFMNMGITELFANIPTGAYFYSWIISIVWRILGSSTTIIRILNAILSYYCCIIIYDLSQKIYHNSKVEKTILWATILFPSLIRFSAPFASRETIFVFMLLLMLKNLYEYYKKNKLIYLVKSLLFFVLGIILHVAILAFVVVYLFIIFDKYRKQDAINAIIKMGAMLGIIIIFIFVLMKNDIGTEKFNIGGEGVSLEKVGWLQESSAEGRAAYLTNFNFTNPVLVVLTLPIRVLFFLYTPFIWMIRNLVDILGFVDAVLYLYLTYCIWKQIRIDKKEGNENKFQKYVLMGTVLAIILMSAVTSNYGTALRHRAKVVIPLIFLAGPALLGTKRKDKVDNNEI